MRPRNQSKRGQALLMITLALFAMCGLIGLAVDLGWSFFVRKAAQASADAAAVAAARAAITRIGVGGPWSCSSGSAQCVSPPVDCPAAGGFADLQAGCQYARQNRLFATGDWDHITIESGEGNPPTIQSPRSIPTAFWVTVRVTQQVPQLFSAVLGNSTGVVSARATAAVSDGIVIGSLRLLNREMDRIPADAGLLAGNKDIYGLNMYGQAQDLSLDASGGILMASTRHGEADPNGNPAWAAILEGGTGVTDPFAWFRGAGWRDMSNNSTWVEPPTKGHADGEDFLDPMRGLGQPPPPVSYAGEYGYEGGVITGSNDPNNPLVLPPGAYYATRIQNNTPIPTGVPLTITGSVKFEGAGFGDYVFFGGVQFSQSGQGITDVQFSPGRYIFAGVQEKANQSGELFSIQGTGVMKLRDTAAVSGGQTAGEIFIFTDPNYSGGLNGEFSLPQPSWAAAYPSIYGSLKQGKAGFQTGNNSDVELKFTGLNKNISALPTGLDRFDTVLWWQDQRNSYVDYSDQGNITCGNYASGCFNTDYATDGVFRDSPMMFYKATPSSLLSGTIYQPRGAWLDVTAGSGQAGSMQIITGAIRWNAGAIVSLLPVNSRPLHRMTVSLID
jgi:hypothetical protein